MNNCKIIAEIGNTHIGDIKRAKFLINLAKSAGADYVKLQKRNPKESTPKHLLNSPHPNSKFSYGPTYLAHREAIELSIKDHIELFDFCNSIGIKYSTSVWDITSAKEVIQEINPDYIKIPSAHNKNEKLLDYIFSNFNKKVHISLGMLDSNEKNSLFNSLDSVKEKIIYYHCTSIYPCPANELNLLEINIIKEKFSIAGFSDHSLGTSAAIAAYILGASFIEKHFIDSKIFKHSDAKSSLNFGGFKGLTSDIKNLKDSLTTKNSISDKEKEQISKLRNY